MPPTASPHGSFARRMLRDDVTIGVIAALPVEAAAISILIENPQTLAVDEDPNRYRVGYLRSSDSAKPHRIALVTLPQDNTRNAAATCTDLLRTFQGIRCVLMVGVAGGVPAPDRPERHVRLGDVVVATEGIVDFGHVRQVDGAEIVRRQVDGVCVDLLRAVNELRQREIETGAPAWSDRSGTFGARPLPAFERPEAETDRLMVDGRVAEHPHPALSGHQPGRPKVHYGLIGSGDVLLRDERRRDELAALHHILAVEMEGSGIAVSARLRGVQWFMVRGIVDYCENTGKSDRWHPYAALMAARYTLTLLGLCRPFPAWRTAPRSGVLALLPDPERDDIVRLLNATPGLDPRALWHAAAGEFAPLPAEPLLTLGEVFDDLCRLNADDGLPPALTLLEEAARIADHRQAGRLRWWADFLAERLQATEALQRRRQADKGDPPRSAKPGLVIRIVPDGIDSRRCVTDYWIQTRSGPWQPEPGSESVETLFGSLEPVIEGFIRHAERVWRHSTAPIAIEFLLPTALLNLAAEWWNTDLDAAVPSPLCADYEVTLRNLDRMRAEHRHRMWHARWRRLWCGPGAQRVLWGDGPNRDLAQWDARLRFDPDVTVVVLSASPATALGRDELDLALRAGVPVILWDRREHADAAAGAALRQLSETAPEQLLDSVRRLRMEAAVIAAQSAGKHPGRHLAVLWDDPDRLVDLAGMGR